MTKSKYDLGAAAHPAADMFPLLDDDELAILAADIKANGLKVPITIDIEGRILDGRNRARACVLAKVEPTTITYDGDAPGMFVLSANAYRRHMSKGALAMTIGLVLQLEGKRAKGRWVRGSLPAATSRSGSISAQRMAEVGLILDHGDPDIIKRVVNGDLALAAAVDLVKPPPAIEPASDPPEVAGIVEAEGASASVPEGRTSFPPDADGSAGVEPRGSKPERTSRRERPVTSPADRKQRRAVNETHKEDAMAVIEPLLWMLDRLDMSLHEIKPADLAGKPRTALLEALARFTVTIEWAIPRLQGKEGG